MTTTPAPTALQMYSSLSLLGDCDCELMLFEIKQYPRREWFQLPNYSKKKIIIIIIFVEISHFFDFMFWENESKYVHYPMLMRQRWWTHAHKGNRNELWFGVNYV